MKNIKGELSFVKFRNLVKLFFVIYIIVYCISEEDNALERWFYFFFSEGMFLFNHFFFSLFVKNAIVASCFVKSKWHHFQQGETTFCNLC